MLKALALVPLLSTFVYAATFTVGVGKDETTGKKGKGFDPSEIYPNSGDTIVLEFRSGAHSVVESTFEKPCHPKDGGYNSGIITVADSVEVDAMGLPTLELTVTGKDPVWFFDQAGGLCNQGAVLAVNAGGSQSAPDFKANALGEPGEDYGPPDSAASTPPSSTGSESGTSSPSTSPATDEEDNTDGAGQMYAGLSVVAVGLLSGFMLV